MDRETKVIETPKGVKIEVKTYLTGRENRDLQNIFLKDVEISGMADKKPEFKNFKASVMIEANNFLIETMVVSVNEVKEDCLNKVLDLPSDEYDYVMKALNEISGEQIEKKKE